MKKEINNALKELVYLVCRDDEFAVKLFGYLHRGGEFEIEGDKIVFAVEGENYSLPLNKDRFETKPA